MQRPTPDRWDRYLLVGWILLFAIARAGRVQDTDPYWQVVAGREVLNGSPLARPDTWSWAPVDGLFYPNSPAWNVALAAAWDLAGSWGMFILSALTIAGYFALVAYLARRLGAGALATIGAIVVTALAALPMLSPRAGVAAQLLLMAALSFSAAWAPRSPRRHPLTNIAVVAVVGFALSSAGNWVHLSWSTLALAVAAAWAVLWFLWPGLTMAGRVAMAGAGAVGLLAGIAVGPYGMSVFERARVVLEACRGIIVEWTGPFTPATALFWSVPALIAIGVAVWAVVWCVSRYRRAGSSDPRLAIAASITVIGLPAAFAGVTAIRFIGLALLTLAPLTALAISRSMNAMHAHFLRSRRQGRSRAIEYTGAPAWRILLTLLFAVLAPLTLIYASPHAAPATAEATLALPTGCRLFSQSNESAAVILLRPDVPIWIDGRADYWGRERLEEMRRLILEVDPERPTPVGTTCVLLPPVAFNPEVVALTSALDASPDWQRLATTGTAVVWVRRH